MVFQARLLSYDVNHTITAYNNVELGVLSLGCRYERKVLCIYGGKFSFHRETQCAQTWNSLTHTHSCIPHVHLPARSEEDKKHMSTYVHFSPVYFFLCFITHHQIQKVNPGVYQRSLMALAKLGKKEWTWLWSGALAFTQTTIWPLCPSSTISTTSLS